MWGKVFMFRLIRQRQLSNHLIGWCLDKVVLFLRFNLMSDQLSRLTSSILLSWRASVYWMMWSQRDKGASTAWEEHTIHQIMASTVFPFHWNPNRATHTHEDPLLYLEQGLPCLLLSCSLNSRRLMSTGPIPLFTGRAAPIHLLALLWNPMHLPRAKPRVSQYTHHSSVLAFPAVAHKLSKPSSTFSHCAGLKGRLAGDVEKSCVCLNMSLKSKGGVLVKPRPVWLGCTHQT